MRISTARPTLLAFAALALLCAAPAATARAQEEPEAEAPAATEEAPAAEEETSPEPEPAPAAAAAEPEPEPESEPLDIWTRGFLDVRYRIRTSEGDDVLEARDDQDVYGYLFVEAGVGRHARIELSGQLVADIDGQRPSIYNSVNDTWDHRAHVYLYEAFAELRDLGPIALVRAGRQFHAEGVDIRFDGARVRTAPLGGGIVLEAYGGVPAHLYEGTARDDWLAGGAIELRTFERTVVRAEYVHVTDRRRVLGGGKPTRDDDLFLLTVRHQVSETIRLFARASTFEGRSTRVRGELYYVDARADFSARLRYVGQFGSYRDLSIDFSPYDEVIGPYRPFHELSFDLRKGFAGFVWLGGGVSDRILVHDDDEGPFNHEFLRVWVFGEVRNVPWAGLAASVLAEHYRSDDPPDRTFVASFDLTQQVTAAVRASVGTAYAHYKVDEFFLEERRDVRIAYARLTFLPVPWLRFRVGYQLERDDEETYHEARAEVRISW